MANNKNQALPPGTVVRSRESSYTIEKVLGQGAFGITYRASTLMAKQLGRAKVRVALKEFFAQDLDSRSADGTVTARTEGGIAHKYAKAFQRESQNLSKMDHPGIVHVLEAFEANGTYYYSMEYISGGSLDDKVKGNGIPEAEALPLIAQIGDALSYMHDRKMMHLDLKPKNIVLQDDGSPVIIDFGLSKQYDANGEPESSSTIGLGTPGYAPLEQGMDSTGKTFQPTLDIYALGATLYKMLTGKTPPLATFILNQRKFPTEELEAKNVSAATVDVIRHSMAPFVDERPQSVGAFLSLLRGANVGNMFVDDEKTVTRIKPAPKPEPKPEPKPGPEPKPTPVPRSAPRPKAWLWALLGGIAAAVVAGIIWGGRIDRGGDDSAVQEENQVASSREMDVASPSNMMNGHEFVDLGLSVKWATMNVGASSPEEFGDYFAWGETKPKSAYSWENYKFYVSGDYMTNVVFSKYNTESGRGKVDNKIILELSDDAANVNWGGTWRMPTQEELKELKEKCSWTWTTLNGKKGYKVTSKSNANSIFLPAAGARLYDSVSMEGSEGFYFSSSLDTEAPHYARTLYFTYIGKECAIDVRFCGSSIRPVTK